MIQAYTAIPIQAYKWAAQCSPQKSPSGKTLLCFASQANPFSLPVSILQTSFTCVLTDNSSVCYPFRCFQFKELHTWTPSGVFQAIMPIYSVYPIDVLHADPTPVSPAWACHVIAARRFDSVQVARGARLSSHRVDELSRFADFRNSTLRIRKARLFQRVRSGVLHAVDKLAFLAHYLRMLRIASLKVIAFDRIRT